VFHNNIKTDYPRFSDFARVFFMNNTLIKKQNNILEQLFQRHLKSRVEKQLLNQYILSLFNLFEVTLLILVLSKTTFPYLFTPI